MSNIPRQAIVASSAIVLLPALLSACNDHSLTEMLNGGSASATSNERTPYMTGSTLTQAQLDQLRNYAPGQTTMELRHVLKAPDSYTRDGDFYRTADGRMVKIPYDAAGRWTGQVEQAEVPTWQSSPYPGMQP